MEEYGALCTEFEMVCFASAATFSSARRGAVVGVYGLHSLNFREDDFCLLNRHRDAKPNRKCSIRSRAICQVPLLQNVFVLAWVAAETRVMPPSLVFFPWTLSGASSS